MFTVRYVTGAGKARAAMTEERYASKAEALSAIFRFNEMKNVQKTRDPKTGGTLWIATRYK